MEVTFALRRTLPGTALIESIVLSLTRAAKPAGRARAIRAMRACMVKHVIIERPLPGCMDKLERHGVELQLLILRRGWTPYRAWRIDAAETGQAGLFDLGMLRLAGAIEEPIAVFEADFPDRAALERQLHALRNDTEAVGITVAASRLVDPEGGRSYVLQDWRPVLPG